MSYKKFCKCGCKEKVNPGNLFIWGHNKGNKKYYFDENYFEKIDNPESAKALVKKAFTKFSLPYMTLTPTFSICPVHGYISGEHFTCPKCTIEQPCEVYSRIVGYLRPVQQWNKGKAEEYKNRVEYKQ